MTQTSWRCAVVGSGLMGAAIGQVLAAAGHQAALYDPSESVRAGPRLGLRHQARERVSAGLLAAARQRRLTESGAEEGEES